MLSFSSMFFCFAAIQFKSHNPWTARRFPPRIAPMPATQEFAEEAYRFPFLFTPCMVFYRIRKLDSGWLSQMLQIPFACLCGLQH